MSLFASPRAQPASATVNTPSSLEKGHESKAQPGPFPSELQHSLEQPAVTGLTFSPARLQQGHSPYPDFSYVHPGILDTQERSSRPTGSDVRDGQVTTRPDPLELHSRRVAKRSRHAPGAQLRVGQRLEDGPPPPGLLLPRLSKRKKVEAQGRETKEKYERCKTWLKDSASAEPNPTTSYTLDDTQYVKS